MASYRAYRAHNEDGRVSARVEELAWPDIDAGEVLIAAQWSGINYKDVLAATGAGKIVKRFPMTVGIDVAGTVHDSRDSRFQPGAPVLVVGCGLGEDHDGGFAEVVRARGEWIVPLPAGLSLRDAMAIGTAGFTAAMAVQRMEDNGLVPGQGPVLVSGATGGVGSLAVDILARRGYEVTALTGKAEATDYLHGLGARHVLLRAELALGTRPLEKALWAGAVDNLGGEVLAWLCRTMQPLGNIASIGLAASPQLNTTVLPFILRGINLLGINSTYCPGALRARVWARLASDLRPARLDAIVQREVSLEELPTVVGNYLQSHVRGRTLVRLAGA